jgi:hypothetical protein
MHSIRIDILDSKAMQFLKGLQELKLIRVSEERGKPARKKALTAFRQPGLAKGLIVIKDNFDDPVEGFDAPVE